MNTFKALFLMEIRKFQQGWIWSLVLASLFPLSILTLLKFSAGGPERAVAVISGSIIFSLMLNTTLNLGQELAVMREARLFDFYASVPVNPAYLISAILGRAVLFSLPAVLVVGLAGFFMFGFHLQANWFAMILVLVLSSISLSGLGALIGFYSPNARFAGLATQTLNLLIVFFSPVMTTPESLPVSLQAISWIFPSTYAAEALRSVFSGNGFTLNFWINSAVLMGFSGASLYLVITRLRWRI